MRGIAQELVKMIRRRTRQGFGVPRIGGDKRRFKRLSLRYIEFRKTFPRLSDETTPRKSNVTLTGEMVDDLKVVQAKRGMVRIGFGSGRNLRKAEHLEEQGRKWLRLSGEERDWLTESIDDALGRSLKAEKL